MREPSKPSISSTPFSDSAETYREKRCRCSLSLSPSGYPLDELHTEDTPCDTAHDGSAFLVTLSMA